MNYQLTLGDALEWLRAIPSESVDLVVSDPPYASLEKHRKVGTTTRLKHSKASSNDWFPIMPNDRFRELFAEFYRVLRADSHLYMFCDQETMFLAKPIGEASGFRFVQPLIFNKLSIGMGYHYRAMYECILLFEKGERKLNGSEVADIIEAKRIRGGYPTQKPVAVSKVLIEQSSSVGDLVIDPFMGSGSVGVAAIELGRRFQGCDVMPGAVELAESRLHAAQPVGVDGGQ